MSFRGRGRGGGGGRGGFRGGRGGFRGRGGGGNFQQGPPETVIELGSFNHPCEGDLVCKCTNEKIPYFNAPVYLENKEQIGKVDDIFGPMQDFFFSVKVSDNMNASSFKKGQKFFIDPYKLLPLARFLPKPPGFRGGRGGHGR
ncbi:H/ACA ribonucleoprotein complex subunit 1 [Nematostella vectensis]|uniref:H/ACA ribonucleoprotein complex subunit 1 n=1 Tax=Nematostella vectensis TaxID=45351 RepID=UPI0020773AA1|nr:H/ACA ribonucleoprotein complex subunit 1 [Nematostella vectensis]